MSLTKAEIVNAVHNNLRHSKAHSAEVVESLLEIMKSTLANGEDILISGFGKFCVKNKEERKGRNPQTKDDMMLGSRRVVTFRIIYSIILPIMLHISIYIQHGACLPCGALH